MTITWVKSTFSTATSTQSEVGWRKPRRSMGNGNCFEPKNTTDTVFIRDTKNRDKGTLAFPKDVFANFIDTIKSGELDK